MLSVILYILLLLFVYSIRIVEYCTLSYRIPNAHPTNCFSGLWILWKRYRSSNHEVTAVAKAHQKHGSFIRLGPREISIASFDADVRRLFGGRLEKHPWYTPFSNYSHPNCMSTLDARSHAIRRHCVAQPYLKANVKNSERLRQILNTILLDRLALRLPSKPASTSIIDVAALCFATVTDIVTSHIFGLALAPNLLRDDSKRLLYQRAYSNANWRRSMFWSQEVPCLSTFLPVPARVTGSRSFLESIVSSLCTQAEAMCTFDTGKIDSPSFPSLYRSFKNCKERHMPTMTKVSHRLELASEVLDHLKATSEVLSTTLAFAMHELSKNQGAQSKLRAEVRAIWQPNMFQLPHAKEIDELQYLDAVVCETLRLRPTAPDGQPRVSRYDCTLVHGLTIPANIRIRTYPYILHRDERIFPSPHEWRPERWIDSDLDPTVHLWAFGLGARACLGRHLATSSKYRVRPKDMTSCN